MCLKNKEGKKYPTINLVSISYSLLEIIQDFLKEKDISSYLGKETEINSRYTRDLVKYRLQINGRKNTLAFFDKIGSRNQRNLKKYSEFMGMKGIEPLTTRASVVRSPTELHPRVKAQ